jgi:hypothetical protein
MGFGTTKPSQTGATIFVDLKTNAKGGKDAVGFRQVVGETIVKDESGADKRQKTYAMHDFVSGRIAGFKAKEEPSYDDHEIKEWVGYLTLMEQGAPNVVVRFPMERMQGRRMVGLINGALEKTQSDVFLRITFTPANTKLGDRTTDTDLVFLTLRVGGPEGEKLDPLFRKEDGSLMIEANGKPTPLPAPVEVMINKKIVLNNEVADNIVANTAFALMTHFEAVRQTRKPSDGSDDSIDADEAARAAASPRG